MKLLTKHIEVRYWEFYIYVNGLHLYFFHWSQINLSFSLYIYIVILALVNILIRILEKKEKNSLWWEKKTNAHQTRTREKFAKNGHWSNEYDTLIHTKRSELDSEKRILDEWLKINNGWKRKHMHKSVRECWLKIWQIVRFSYPWNKFFQFWNSLRTCKGSRRFFGVLFFVREFDSFGRSGKTNGFFSGKRIFHWTTGYNRQRTYRSNFSPNQFYLLIARFITVFSRGNVRCFNR